MAYDTFGSLTEVEPPFILHEHGCKDVLSPQLNATISIELTRKFPVLEYVFTQTQKIVGGEFQAANKSDFSDAKTVYKVQEAICTGKRIHIPDSIGKHRFWRYINNESGSQSTISEISFIQRGTGLKLSGKPICKECLSNDKNDSFSLPFDGNVLTRYVSNHDSGGWVGMEFNLPVEIESISYYPPSDGNSIEIGDEYELFYWYDGEWRSLGKQIATDFKLTYNNAPMNALFQLRDLSKGEDEWIFIWKNGEQLWL